jgi:hypothetical protein
MKDRIRTKRFKGTTVEDLEVIIKASIMAREAQDDPRDDSRYRLGLSFGYPVCCIEFFCSYPHELDVDYDFWSDYREVGASWVPFNPERGNEWIHCPACVLGSRYGRPLPVWLQRLLDEPGSKLRHWMADKIAATVELWRKLEEEKC